MTFFNRFVLGVIGAATLCVAAAPAGAATTIGNTNYTVTDTMEMCNNSLYVGEETEYRSPVSGVVTSWRVVPGTAGGSAQLAVVSDNLVNLVTVKALSAIQPINAVDLTFPARTPISTGDYVGVWGTGGFYCEASVMPGTGDNARVDSTGLTVGLTNAGNRSNNHRPIVAATVESDVDSDGFGDETQDQCPTNPTRQVVPCFVAQVTPVTVVGATCKVPSLKGKTKSAATDALNKAGCKLGKIKKKKLRKFTKKQKRNRVRSQSRPADSVALSGATVDITINVKKKK